MESLPVHWKDQILNIQSFLNASWLDSSQLICLRERLHSVSKPRGVPVDCYAALRRRPKDTMGSFCTADFNLPSF